MALNASRAEKARPCPRIATPPSGRMRQWRRGIENCDFRFALWPHLTKLLGHCHPILDCLALTADLVQQSPLPGRERPRSGESYRKRSDKPSTGCDRVWAARALYVRRAFDNRRDLSRIYRATAKIAQRPKV